MRTSRSRARTPRRPGRPSSRSVARERNRRTTAVVLLQRRQRRIMGNVKTVSNDEWKTVVEGASNHVLVDFFATWCGPCKYVAPIVEDLAKEYSGKVDCTKLDIDEAPEIATRYGIEGVPTLVLFKGGQEIDRMVGAS